VSFSVWLGEKMVRLFRFQWGGPGDVAGIFRQWRDHPHAAGSQWNL